MSDLSTANILPRYVPEYYENGSMLENAEDVTVAAGSVVSDIDAQLGIPGRITGSVTDGRGNTIENIFVQVYCPQDNADTTLWSVCYAVATDASGKYEIGGLASGTYRVGFVDSQNPPRYLPEYYNGASSLESAGNITVIAGATATGIDAQLATFGHITGTVTDGSGAPLANIFVQVYCLGDDGAGNIQWNSCYGSGYTNASGAYDIGDLAPATYRIGFRDSQDPQRYVPEYYKNALASRDR